MMSTASTISHDCLRRPLLAASLVFLIGGSGSSARPSPSDGIHIVEHGAHLRAVQAGPARLARLYATDQFTSVPSEVVTRPICGSRPGALGADTLMQIAQADAGLLQAPTPLAPFTDGVFRHALAGGGLNLVLQELDSVPPEASLAIAEAESFVESKFTDPTTVRIVVRYRPLDPEVLGVTSTSFLVATWNASRAGLQSGMDANDVVQSYLPTGSLLKVRYNGSSGTLTNENRVFWTHANYKATMGSLSGASGVISINENVTWDYDPSDGIDPGAASFQDVLIHEIGHVFGFSSGVDGRTADLEALDLFRFQFTDGTQDFNPDTAAEFTDRPRLVDFDNPDDNAVSDIIFGEYRMSDGDPWQASHFREQSPRIGLMDPALADEETYYPSFFTVADLRIFDAIGWDR
jgi:hypothetical protein